MTLDTLSPEDKTELDMLEQRLQKRSRMTRYVGIAILVGALGVGGWLASGIASYAPPEASPLEQLLTEDFAELQLAWFDTISSASRVNAGMAAEKQGQFNEKVDRFIAKVAEVEPELKESFTRLTQTMSKQNQMTLLEEENPSDAIRKPVSAVNEVLARLEPRFYLEVDNFEGLLDNQYLMGTMLLVYEVLGTLSYRGGDEEGNDAQLLVVRRRDSLPAQGAAHGYVHRDDTSVAFVLQDTATQFAADYIFPSFGRPEAAFELRFERGVPDRLKAPFKVLVELVHLELRTLAGLDEETMKTVAGNVARRARIFNRASEAALKHGVDLKLPDGLVWPRSFASRVLLENTELNKRGEELLLDGDKDSLIQVSRALDNDVATAALDAIAQGITRSVGFHEARHVLDIRSEVEAGTCLQERVQITDDDPDFLRSVELEARARLTQFIEAPETVRLTLLSTVAHLYSRSGTADFYAARTILHPLAFADDEENIPRGWDYVSELTLRLGAAPPETLATSARAFYEECFEPYVPLRLTTEERLVQESAGCSAAGF